MEDMTIREGVSENVHLFLSKREKEILLHLRKKILREKGGRVEGKKNTRMGKPILP